MLDVGVRRGVRVDVHVHDPRRRVDRGADAAVPRQRQRRTAVGAGVRVDFGQPRLRLDREEAARVVLEVFRAQDHQLVLVRQRRDDGLVERGRVGAVLLAHVGLARLDPVAPRVRTLDRPADLEARGVEVGDLVVVPEDRDRDGAVGSLADVLLVEVHAVLARLDLEPHRRALVREMHLDQALALVRIDAPLVRPAVRRTTRPRERTYARADQHPPP
jgi:hypothetical protein